MRKITLAIPLLAVAAGASALAQEAKPDIQQSIEGNIVRPQQVPASDESIAKLSKPNGVTVEKFADNLVNPRIIAIDGKGRLYVSRRSVGDLLLIEDTNGDGKADRREVVATRPQLHGVAIDGDTLYFATVKEIYRAPIKADGTLGEITRIVDNLPDGGQHPNRTLAIGPDGMLYVTVGSTCNACMETNQESATILKMKPDGSDRAIYASGLRNTIGFGWTRDGALYGMDQGIDFLGDDAQLEELNRIEEGKKYGWPYAFEDNQINYQPPPPPAMSREEWAARGETPVLGYRAHAAAMQMAFAPEQGVPETYRGDAFVAMRGSWNRNPPSCYEIVRIDFENGKPQRMESFISGFLVENGDSFQHFGRPVGIAFAPDGTLYFGDDTNGVIYRARFTADPVNTGTTAASPVPTAEQDRAIPQGGDKQQARQKTPTDLAKDLVQGGERGSLKVRSDAFGDGERIPLRYSEYGEGISPPLSIAGAPAATRSFVIMMEDPDVPRDMRPFVHWIAYNIPAGSTELMPGVAPQEKLVDPSGAMQGVNSAGRVGYMGPMPPIGDERHDYHTQVFALDTMLDLPPGADRAKLLEAMRGHVLAMGELRGTFQARENINAQTDPQPDGDEKLE